LGKRAFEYWVAEYKIDGYRIDLAKGFTKEQQMLLQLKILMAGVMTI
jgi:pullulanase/glycogen debranching enzyme